MLVKLTSDQNFLSTKLDELKSAKKLEIKLPLQLRRSRQTTDERVFSFSLE